MSRDAKQSLESVDIRELLILMKSERWKILSDACQMMREEWIGGGGGLQRFASGFLLCGTKIYNSKPRAVEEGNPTTIRKVKIYFAQRNQLVKLKEWIWIHFGKERAGRK